MYGISSFCTLSENNSFLHGKISYFCIFLVKNRILNTEFSAMSHAIHKIVSKERCQSYFISRRSPHLGISKDSELCASAHRCLHYAYARLIARVNSQFTLRFCTVSHHPVFPNCSHCICISHRWSGIRQLPRSQE